MNHHEAENIVRCYIFCRYTFAVETITQYCDSKFRKCSLAKRRKSFFLLITNENVEAFKRPYDHAMVYCYKETKLKENRIFMNVGIFHVRNRD